ncbi:MAG: hypothetical protein KH452_13530 [Clostridiales bacterium]|nr:hypothetical protein [Clostridiales bacterium]
MSITELLFRLLAALRPMLPGMIAAVAATLAALVILYVLCRTAWVPDKGFRLAGLFFGLDGRGAVQLACAWLKLIFLIVFVVGFQKLELLNYLMLLLPGLVLALSDRGVSRQGGSLLWLLLQMVGLVSANLICGYIRDMSGGLGFILLYVAMGLFLILFSVYLFLNDLAGISEGRDVDARQIWE